MPTHPTLPNVPLRRHRAIEWPLLVVVSACGPDAADAGDVFPVNCDIEGPVDLFEADMGAWVAAERAGDHYLVVVSPDAVSVEHWAVERCGSQRTLLSRDDGAEAISYGVGGRYLLSCDTDTGAMAVVDPTGIAAPRRIFESVEGCRVVLAGEGLAAQRRGSGTVWFHPAPTNPDVEAIVVTDDAQIDIYEWTRCGSYEFDCKTWHPHGLAIHGVDEDVLVMLGSGELIAYSATTATSRTIHEGPVDRLDVLDGGELLVVGLEHGGTHVVDRIRGTSFEMCCYDDVYRMQRFGEWVVKGHSFAPTIPAEPTWTNFRAHHLPSDTRTEVIGDDAWTPLGRVSEDALLIEITSEQVRGQRNVFYPSSGELVPVELPGDTFWSLPGQDGIFAYSEEDGIRVLETPTSSPRLLAENVDVPFVTRDGRIVLAPVSGRDRALRVRLPDGDVVQVDVDVGYVDGRAPYDERWPIEQDEVTYVAQRGDRWMLRRTVLP